ncbi:MAG: ATP-binding protein [Cyclobacteriaceae bacterium]
MILEIRLSNFFSIKEEVILDLRAGNIQTKQAKELKDHFFTHEKDNILKSVAIYGANASGKSNVIKAIRFCCRMIFQSHLHNENSIFNFLPFKFDGFESKPSLFFIRFVSNNVEFEYSYSLTRKEIITEELYHYPRGRRAKIFARDERIPGEKKDKYSFSNTIKRPLDVAENTSTKTLFISRASQMDRVIGKELFNYFNEQFILGYTGFNSHSLEHNLIKNKEFLLKALQIADSDIVDISYTKEKIKLKSFQVSFNSENSPISNEESEGEVLKIVTYHKASPNIAFDFDTEESEGTKKLFVILLSILDIVKQNKTLLIDEIETSLHSNLVEFIVNLFNASEKAQLIFTTHNTNLLNLRKIRRDQVFFVNKLEDGSSDLYSLFDYKDFRENMDAEKGYLQGRFDAIPFIDETQSSLKTILDGE